MAPLTLKGPVKGLNRVVESMFLAPLPGHARQPHHGERSFRPKEEVLLGFEDFTARQPSNRRAGRDCDACRQLRGSHTGRPDPLGTRTVRKAPGVSVITTWSVTPW